MTLEYMPLLQVQRDLYAMPRDRTRFDAYLATMTDGATGDLALPLSAMNPMGKEHVPALLDQYLAADTDGQAARAVKACEPSLDQIPGSFRVCLVIADDAKGGWTNRYTTEFSHRFESRAMLKRRWVVGLLWTSEPAAAKTAVLEVLVSVHRAAWIGLHGNPRSLGDMLAQEGWAMSKAGCTEPALDGDDLVYTRDAIAPFSKPATARRWSRACSAIPPPGRSATRRTGSASAPGWRSPSTTSGTAGVHVGGVAFGRGGDEQRARGRRGASLHPGWPGTGVRRAVRARHHSLRAAHG